MTNQKRPLIELVTHCYAKEHKTYAAALRYQLSSLVSLQSKLCNIVCTVCLTKKDRLTMAVFDQFATKLDCKGLEFQKIELSVEELGRRCIGRNIAAKQSQADIVWFTDVDYVFISPCMDKLIQLEWPNAVLIYPREIKICKDHYLGDDYLNREPTHWCLAWIDQQDFIDKFYDRPIGGVQIVKGDTARKYGYLGDCEENEKKWLVPAKKPFGDFRDDIAFRKTMQRIGGIQIVEFPGIFRLRHTHITYAARQAVIPRGANG